jgi:Asp/Glu/hydantoin racemase
MAPLLAPGMVLDIQTATTGASYIACEASHAVASAHVLELWADYVCHKNLALNGVLIACFGDPGLFALRESSACAVTGLAEASFIQAAQFGSFSVVTGGARWKPMLERLAMGLGFAAHLQHIETVTPSGAELQANPQLAKACLTHACKAAALPGVQSIILGGAGLAGYAPLIQPSISVPLIDSAHAGLNALISRSVPHAIRDTDGFVAPWTHVCEPMQQLMR